MADFELTPVTTPITTGNSKADKKAAKQAREARAEYLFNKAAADSDSYSKGDVKKDAKAELKEMLAAGVITEQEYNDAVKFANKKGNIFGRIFGRKSESTKTANYVANQNKKEAAEIAEQAYYQYDSDKTKWNQVRKDIRNQENADYKAKTGIYEGMTDEAAKQVHKSFRGQTHSNMFKRMFEDLGYKSESDVKLSARSDAWGNKIDTYKNEFANGKRKLSKDMQKKVDAAGYTIEQLYDMAQNEYGSNNRFDYSYSSGTRGATNEARGFAGALSSQGNKVQFTQGEAMDLAKELGIEVEDQIRLGRVIGKGVLPGAAVGSLGFISQTQSMDVAKTGVIGVTGTLTQSQNLGGPITLGAAIAVGTGLAIADEIKRTEPKVAEKDLPDHIETYRDYAAFVENGCTDKGADIMLKIAKFYTKKDGKLNIPAMQDALKAAAGENSVLNYQEALTLYKNLVNGKIEVPQEEPHHEEPKPQTCEVQPMAPIINPVTVEDCTENHEIKEGDNWYTVIEDRYNVHGDDLKAAVRQIKDAYYEKHKEDLQAKGKMNSRAAFFPAVGDTLTLPCELNINNHQYEYKTDAKVRKNALDPAAKYDGVTFENNSNPFTHQEDDITYRAGNGCDEGKHITTSKESQEAANKAQEDYIKKQGKVPVYAD